VKLYHDELMLSKDPKDQEKFEQFSSWNQVICNLMLSQYINQCDLKHNMAFMQFRNIIIPSFQGVKNFESRKDYYRTGLEHALEKINDGALDGYCIRTDKEIME
jgi:hypothetical protein